MRIVAVIALVAGCVPFPQETMRTTTRTIEPPIADRPQRPVLRAETYDGVVDVVATWQRSCRRRVRDVVEDYEARVRGTTTREVEAETLVTPCSLAAANIPLHLTLASGKRVDAVTDRDGRFALVLPTSEPPGPVRVITDAEQQPDSERELEPPPENDIEIEDVSPAQVVPPVLTPPAAVVPPTLTPPTPTGLPAVARAAVNCAGQLGLAGMAKIRVAVAPDGTITDVQVDRGDALVRCMRSELATARFPPTGSAQKLELPLLLRRP